MSVSSAPAAVHVRLLLFARLREIAGEERIDLELPAQATPEDCFVELVRRHPRAASLRDRVLVAVNARYAAWDAALEAGDEIAFIPPVSGG